MKVLAIDDQQLVLLPLQKRLTDLGYDVKIETNASKGLKVFDAFNPDLVILDINMPDISGFDVISHIRITKGRLTPIMILSGVVKNDNIVKAFELGVNDYMKKPLSLSEICVRVKHLIGTPNKKTKLQTVNDVIIHQRCVGVVIPCYNEEERLLSCEFLNFVNKN